MNDMDWDLIDWDAVRRLREGFLSGEAGQKDYWQSLSDLQTYDQTFAQRIAWKWEFVLKDLSRLSWSPPEGLALDWGCGTGIAARTFANYWPQATAQKLALLDRSAMAMDFAVEAARRELPDADVSTGLPDETPATLLVSHVLSELRDSQLSTLLALASRATAVIWIEPGTHEISRRLIAVREQLRGQFGVVAPCTHQAVCGMLAAGNERHWCHHFVPAPAYIHTDGNWRKFGILAGIDLRALPLSYLVLDRRPVPVLPEGTRRVIGHPRVYKAYAQLFGCDATGVHDYRLMKRHDAEAFHDLKKERSDTLQTWQTQDAEIMKVLSRPEP